MTLYHYLQKKSRCKRFFNEYYRKYFAEEGDLDRAKRLITWHFAFFGAERKIIFFILKKLLTKTKVYVIIMLSEMIIVTDLSEINQYYGGNKL